jgi:hypothetical protein
MRTAFDYMYRDAGNFKAFGSILLEGVVTKTDRDLIRRSLDGGEYFIAEQVGVLTLYDQLYRWSSGPTKSDHCWHEFIGFRELAMPIDLIDDLAPAEEFIARFVAIEHWDLALSPHFWLAGSASL